MNESAVVPFYFQENEVRTVTIENDPWFVARDVCDALGLSNVAMALERIPESHLTSVQLMSGGQMREMRAVDEPGLFRLILRSDKPQAEPFMEWITTEVLPTIRKTGGYLMPGYAAITKDELYTLQAEVIDLYRKNAELMQEKITKLEYKPEKRVHRPLTEEDKEKIIEMVASGMPQREVARVMQRSSATVSYLVSNRLRETQQ